MKKIALYFDHENSKKEPLREVIMFDKRFNEWASGNGFKTDGKSVVCRSISN